MFLEGGGRDGRAFGTSVGLGKCDYYFDWFFGSSYLETKEGFRLSVVEVVDNNNTASLGLPDHPLPDQESWRGGWGFIGFRRNICFPGGLQEGQSQLPGSIAQCHTGNRLILAVWYFFILKFFEQVKEEQL